MANKNFTVKNGLEVGGQEVISSSGAITSAALGGQVLGTSASPSFANITTAGYLRGPASFVIDPAAHGDDTGTVVIAGNLQVDGTQTTINSTTMTVDDLNLTLASGAANAAAANGAGINVDISGATNPSLVYGSSNDDWTFNKNLNVTGNVTAQAISGTSLSIDTLSMNGSSIGSSGNMTLDSANSIILDADGGDVMLKDNSVWFGNFNHNGSNLRIDAKETNGNIHLNPNGTGSVNVLSSLMVGSTTAPSAKLEVQGGTTYPAMKLSRDGGSAGTQGYTTYGHSAIGYSGGTGADTYIVSEHGFGFAVNAGTNALTITDDGKVGIGTNNPDQPLHVVGTRPLRLERSGVGEFEISIDNTVSGDSSDFVIEPVSGTNSAGFQVRTRNTGGSLIEAVNVNHDGQVGIGTDSPAGPLHVDGHTGSLATILEGNGNGDTVPLHFRTKANNGNVTNYGIFGNAGSTGTGNTILIGPTNSSGLTVNSSGNVGIGTTSPLHSLHIQYDSSTVYSGTSDQGGGIYVNNIHYSALNSFSQIRLGVSGGSGASHARLVAIEPGQAQSDFAICLRNSSTYFERFRIKGLTGNVGIGTDNPGAKLRVEGLASSVNLGGGSVNSAALYVNAASGHNGELVQIIDKNNVEQLHISNGGNVGIGTGAPGSYKLNVNGETRSLGLYSAGSTNLGTNGGSNVSDKTLLAGYGILAGNGVRYGNYGNLTFRSSSGYTAGARSFLITNGYDANKFAIIQSTTHTTIPDIDGAGGGANNGEPRFVIDNGGNIGVGGVTSPAAALDVLGRFNVQNGQVWSETTQGGGRGSIHIDPNSATDHTGGAITFGASDTGGGTSGQAGIYVRSDGSYGTKMYLSTCDSYAQGSKTSIAIMHEGEVLQPRQSRFQAYGGSTGYNPLTYSHSVKYPSTSYNIGSDYSGTTGLYTAPYDGYYIFEASTYSTSAASNGWGQAWLTLNGGRGNFTDVFTNTAGSTGGGSNIITTIHTIYLSQGDTVGYHPYTGSGSGYAFHTNPHHTWFRGRLIG